MQIILLFILLCYKWCYPVSYTQRCKSRTVALIVKMDYDEDSVAVVVDDDYDHQRSTTDESENGSSASTTIAGGVSKEGSLSQTLGFTN